MRDIQYFVAALCLAGFASPLFAGVLTPPAGPVAGTMKTLDQVEPRIPINLANTPGDADSLFRITAPGSYYLTGNVTGVASKSGIEIASDSVTIDLMGFTMQGTAGSTVGITTSIVANGAVVRNGVVRGWDQGGISLSLADNVIVEDISALSNSSAGISVGSGALVQSCVASFNTLDGIHCPNPGVIVRACTTNQNGGNGIDVIQDGYVEGCTAFANGFDGITVGVGGAVHNSVARFNTRHGFDLGNGTTATGCSSYQNTLNGFDVGSGAVIRDCTARANTDGFRIGDGTSITGCAAFANSDNGILAGIGASVLQCTTAQNTGDGIEVNARCTVVGNTSDFNGIGLGSGAGIHSTGINNKIDGNNVTNNDRGIDVDSTGSLIINNSARGNTTNYVFVANNKYGRIVDIVNAATPAVNGNSGLNMISTNEPWVNLAY